MTRNFRLSLCICAMISMACASGGSSTTTSSRSSGATTNTSGANTASTPTPKSTGTTQGSGNSAIEYYTRYTYKSFRNAPEFSGNASNSLDAARKVNAILFFMVNEIRAKAGISILPYEKPLEVAAYFHSKEMAEKNFFDHRNPKDSKRRETSDRAKLAGVKNPFIAENIVYVHADATTSYMAIAEKMMNQWMNSSGHKKNILSKDSKSLGCGVYYKGGRWYGTQVFQWFYPVETQEATDKF